MYYNRKLDKLENLIKKGGLLRWLFDYVKDSKDKDLDFLVGKNNQKEWISVYRGLSRLLTIELCRDSRKIKFGAADTYKLLAAQKGIDIYGEKEASFLTIDMFNNLVEAVRSDHKFDRYYKNKKEGYYQNILSRRYGICGMPDDEFVIIDKEAVIGYSSKGEKDREHSGLFARYKKLRGDISSKDPKRYGSNLIKKSTGNEVDFLALDKNGNLLIVEYKHRTNTSGIYLSPVQIGLYFDLFNDFFNKEKESFCDSIFQMLKQKQEIEFINPEWPKPNKIKDLIPVLIISEFNKNSVAKDKFCEVMGIVRKEIGDKNFLKILKIYNFTLDSGLVLMNWGF